MLNLQFAKSCAVALTRASLKALLDLSQKDLEELVEDKRPQCP